MKMQGNLISINIITALDKDYYNKDSLINLKKIHWLINRILIKTIECKYLIGY